MKRDDFSMLSDTEIFDKDGNRIGIINAGHYEYADISDISLNLQNAYIAQEDRRFKSHSGVDWIADHPRRAGSCQAPGRDHPGRKHHHPADHQEHLPDPGADIYPEDGGDSSGA